MFKQAFVKGVAGRRRRAEARCSTSLAKSEPVGPRRVPARASIRSRRAASSGALLAQFPPSFKSDQPASRDYLAWLLQAFAGLPRAPSSCGTRAGATRSATRSSLLNAFGRRVRPDRRAEVPAVRSAQNQLPNIRGLYYMRLHGRNARAVVDSTTSSEDRYNYLYSRRRAQRVRRDASTPRASSSRRPISTRTITSRRSRSPTRP